MEDSMEDSMGDSMGLSLLSSSSSSQPAIVTVKVVAIKMAMIVLGDFIIIMSISTSSY